MVFDEVRWHRVEVCGVDLGVDMLLSFLGVFHAFFAHAPSMSLLSEYLSRARWQPDGPLFPRTNSLGPVSLRVDGVVHVAPEISPHTESFHELERKARIVGYTTSSLSHCQQECQAPLPLPNEPTSPWRRGGGRRACNTLSCVRAPYQRPW